MRAVELIKQALTDCPGISVTETAERLTVSPASPTGFKVWIDWHPPAYTVGFEGWHEQIADDDEAAKCFLFGLSAQCKLRVFRRGSFDYKWQLHFLSGGDWVEDSETGLVFFPFWKRAETRELQNDVIELPPIDLSKGETLDA